MTTPRRTGTVDREPGREMHDLIFRPCTRWGKIAKHKIARTQEKESEQKPEMIEDIRAGRGGGGPGREEMRLCGDRRWMCASHGVVGG